MNIDSHGLIVQADGDGGDTAQRMGMFYLGVKLSPEFYHTLDYAEECKLQERIDEARKALEGKL